MTLDDRAAAARPAVDTVDVLVAGLGPGGCAAALAAHREGLRILAVESRGPQGSRSRLVLVRPGAQEALRQIGLPDLTQGRRASTIREVEEKLREALEAAAAGLHDKGPASSLSMCWHTRVVALQPCVGGMQVSLLDGVSGQQRTVMARHVVDATGGRLESLGRPARASTGRSHLVATAVYDTEPWFDGIAGTRDRATGEALVLVPMRGRGSITAYLDALPGGTTDRDTLQTRFETVAQQLQLGTPREPVLVVDVVQRLLQRASTDRVLPIGDSVGTVDLWLGAGMSTAIEDALDAARAIAAALRETRAEDELAHTRAASKRILGRHRSRKRGGQMMMLARPLLVRLWPQVPLEAVRREAVNCPAVLWPAMRLVAGRRPQRV
jgi:flavin-dependent dehydrogenase